MVTINTTRARDSTGRVATCSRLLRDVWFRTPSVPAGTVLRVSATRRDGGDYHFPVTFAAYRDCARATRATACTLGRDVVFIAPGGPVYIRAGSRHVIQNRGFARFHVEILTAPTPTCDASDDVVGPPTGAASPFRDLSADEITVVREYLLAEPSLELTDFESARRAVPQSLRVNYIMSIERAPPRKADTLAYLDGDAVAPARKARAFVYFGAREPPVARYLEVGPLPLDDATVELVDVTPVASGIPYYKRPAPCDIEYDLMEGHIRQAMSVLDPMTRDSFGASYADDCELCLGWTSTSPRATAPGERLTWLWFFFDVEGSFLQPVGLEFLLNHTGLDPSQWSIAKIVYNYQLYTSAQSLADDYANNRLNKTRIAAADLSWSAFERRVDDSRPARPNADKLGPRLYEPAGKRFSIEGNKINYMGWTMDYGWVRHVGMFLYDVRFFDERILYELGFAEASASYSGYSAEQSWTMYADTAWGMGTSMYSMRVGYDCPHTAVLLSIDIDTPYGPYTWPDAVCVFEQSDGHPQRRHYQSNGDSYSFFSSTPSHSLVVRTMPAVYNYDYALDYVFYLNGLIEVRAASSGYLQAAFYSDRFAQEESVYTMKLRDHMSGALHDHVFAIKADFDIVGTDNSLKVGTIKTHQRQLPWFPSPVTQRYIDHSYVPSEDRSGLEYSFTEPAFWTVVNRGEHNRWDNERGYHVFTNSPFRFHEELRSDWRFASSAWRKYTLLATRQHDSEQMPTDINDQSFPLESIVDVDRYRADNESLAQVDLVMWLTMGHFHLPSAEDVPVSNLPGTFGSFFFKPHNFFDEDPALDLQETVRSDPVSGPFGGVIGNVETFGLELDQACVPSDPLMGPALRPARVSLSAAETKRSARGERPERTMQKQRQTPQPKQKRRQSREQP